MSRVSRAIDCLVNVDMGDRKPPDWMVRVKEESSERALRFAEKCPERFALMIEYRNLRLMTSAWSPRRLPDSLIHAESFFFADGASVGEASGAPDGSSPRGGART